MRKNTPKVITSIQKIVYEPLQHKQLNKLTLVHEKNLSFSEISTLIVELINSEDEIDHILAIFISFDFQLQELFLQSMLKVLSHEILINTLIPDICECLSNILDGSFNTASQYISDLLSIQPQANQFLLVLKKSLDLVNNDNNVNFNDSNSFYCEFEQINKLIYTNTNEKNEIEKYL